MTRILLFLPRIFGVLCLLLLCTTAAADSSEFKKAVAAERKGDYQRAHYPFSMLAGQGDPKAQHALGRLYEHGRGVQGNAQTAMQWYRRAADQGHPDSEYRLAGRTYL